MKNVITISREFGSGGRTIGKQVADRLGYAFYDKELIEKVAEETGFSKEYVKERGEYSPSASAFSYSFMGRSRDGLSTDDYLFSVQRKVILELAEKGRCVIVGRCADYILQEADPFRIFVYADMPSKMRRCREKGYEKEDLTDRELERRINAVNRSRAEYYEYCTGQKWGDRIHYCLLYTSPSPRDM